MATHTGLWVGEGEVGCAEGSETSRVSAFPPLYTGQDSLSAIRHVGPPGAKPEEKVLRLSCPLRLTMSL